LNSESEKKLIINLVNVFQSKKWFLAFGTLLWFLRDRPQGIKMETDLDIGVFHDDVDEKDLERNFAEYGYSLERKTINDVTKAPFQMVFKGPQSPPIPDQQNLSNLRIDVFFFWRVNGRYWHSYDYYNERPKNGIPKEYVFKGMPAHALDGQIIPAIWNENCPPVFIPERIGQCMDEWYPALRDNTGRLVPNSTWNVRQTGYGWSKTTNQRKMKSCKDMRRVLI